MRYGRPEVSPHPHGLHRIAAARLPQRPPASYAKAPLGVRAYLAPHEAEWFNGQNAPHITTNGRDQPFADRQGLRSPVGHFDF